MRNDAESVLANWIEQALSPTSQLPADVPPARWVAEKFLRWWMGEAEGRLDDLLGQAEGALAGFRTELLRLGGRAQFGKALHECIHLGDALAEVRTLLLPDGGQATALLGDPPT